MVVASSARAQEARNTASSPTGAALNGDSVGGEPPAAASASAGGATVATPDRDAQSALVREADTAESEARPADALALWQRALLAAPTSRLAGRCERRIDYLSARAEGDFAPLADLLRMRKVPTASLDAAKLAAFGCEVSVRSRPSIL